MALPGSTELYAELECYGISTATLSAAWINNIRDTSIVPFAESISRIPMDADVKQYGPEYYSGTGSTLLILRRRFIDHIDRVELVINNVTVSQINISSIEVIGAEGVLKSKRNFEDTAVHPLWPRGSDNIKITYTVNVPAKIRAMANRAILCFMCEKALGHLASRTGGGDLSVQALSRSFGPRGRYSHIRSDYAREGHALLRLFSTGDSGQ